MKREFIASLSEVQFVELMSNETWEYIIERFKEEKYALMYYQDASSVDTSDDDEYLGIDEFFELLAECDYSDMD